jgi:hypothetical protein
MSFLQTNLPSCLAIDLPSSKGYYRPIAMAASMVVGLASKVPHTQVQEYLGRPLVQAEACPKLIATTFSILCACYLITPPPATTRCHRTPHQSSYLLTGPRAIVLKSKFTGK